VSLVGKCFCGGIEIAISGSLAKKMAMILNCLAGGANARLLQGAQRNLRGTAGHSQEGLAQGSNRNKQSNTIKQEFGGSPLSDRRSNTRTPDGNTNKALEVLALGQTRQSSGLKRSNDNDRNTGRLRSERIRPILSRPTGCGPASFLRTDQVFRHRHSATMAQTASTNPNGHAPCRNP
jgi:hypothetical protein